MNFNGFVSSTSFEKPLKLHEEEAYFEMYHNGDKRGRDILIERNLRLVAHIVKKYCPNVNDAQDMISIGSIGLIKAISTFDYKKGARLATYAAKCIENEILMYLRGVRKDNVLVSINDPIGMDKEGNEICLVDVITGESVSAEDEIYRRGQISSLYEKMKKYLKKREFFILSLRYGLWNGAVRTQREIGKALGISRSYVSRIEKKALEKLRAQMEEDNYNET